MDSSKRQTTPWTKNHKKPGPKKKEKGEHFDESKKKELAGQRIRHHIYEGHFCSAAIEIQSNTDLKIKLTRANSWR